MSFLIMFSSVMIVIGFIVFIVWLSEGNNKCALCHSKSDVQSITYIDAHITLCKRCVLRILTSKHK